MTTFLAAALTLSMSTPMSQAHDHDKGPAKAEIRVYLADREKKPVDLSDVSASVIIEPKGAPRKTLKTEIVTPKGVKKTGLGHGGEVVEMDGYYVEFVVHTPHAGHDAKGHEEDHHKEEDGTPYFKAALDAAAYSCGMQGHPLTDKPGTCAKCPMTLKPTTVEFQAVVIFKIKGETKNAKGFQHPPAIPADYAGAVARMEEHLKSIESLVNAGSLDKVHGVAEKISRISEKLPALAPKDDRAHVEKVAKEVVGLFQEIDAAADAGKKEETVKAMAKYKAKIAELKAHAKGGDHDHK